MGLDQILRVFILKDLFYGADAGLGSQVKEKVVKHDRQGVMGSLGYGPMQLKVSVGDFFDVVILGQQQLHQLVVGRLQALYFLPGEPLGDHQLGNAGVDDAAQADQILGGVPILKKDADRYSTKAGRTKINACIDSIPAQLSRERKEFTYSLIEKKKNVGKRVYGSSLDWLENAGLIYRCHNITEPALPLSERVDDDNFKVYMTDTGILIHLMEDVDPAAVAIGDPYINHGAIMENAILSDILKKGYKPFYYSKKNSTLEIDFVMSRNNRVDLIEVKSGVNKRAKSLKTLMEQKIDNRDGFKVMIGNILTEDNGIVHLPLYAFSMIEPKKIENIPPAPDLEEINRIFRESRKDMNPS